MRNFPKRQSDQAENNQLLRPISMVSAAATFPGTTEF